MNPFRPDLVAIAKIQGKACLLRAGAISKDEFVRETMEIVDWLEAEIDRSFEEAERELRKEGA